ncbi:MAG: hypothetical protein E6K12_04785 [Methanobacteriota archaeon]|nr:MAG: hypothetical protein E6K12_04785 [Euryarchaeota archaeon]
MRGFSYVLVVLVLASVIAISGPWSATAAPSRSASAVPIVQPRPNSITPFFPNIKITDGTSPFDYQVEPTMVVNHSGTVFVGWKETNGPDAAGYRVGSSYSTDQGLTWAPNILMNQTHPNQNCRDSDPWMALDPNDRVHYAYLEYDPNGGSSPPCSSGLDVSNTTNGQDWGNVHYIVGQGGLVDKDSIAFDSAGRLYATWDEGNILAVTWSDDGGATWAPVINPGSQSAVLGAVIVAAPDGTVYLTWWDFGTNNIKFESSADRGQTWSAIVRVNDLAGSAPGGFPQYPLPAMNVDPNSGAIYVSWADSRNGNPDIYLASSTDGGKTWAANQRINDNTDSSMQYMVDLAVDGTGKVHAAWEDKRLGNWNIFYSNSTDGGQTWSPNVRVSDQDTPGTFDRPGDYFAIEAGPDNKTYVVWTDGRGTNFDIYYARSPGFPTSTVTVTTNPAGLPVTVDGVTSTGPVATAWIVGSSHTVSVASPIPLGTTARYVWSNWSDGGTISHSIVVGVDDATITASFTKQYQSSVSLGPVGLGLSVLVDSVPYTATASFWWDDGSVHQVEAPTPQNLSTDVRYIWFSWSDGGSAAHSVSATAALVLTATFTEQEAMRVSTTPSGATFAVDGTSYSSATAFWFARDSYHTISVATQQSSTPGTRYQFQQWSDGGAAAHVVHFTAAVSFEATFSAEYYLNVTSPVSGAGGSGWYPAGATVNAAVSNQYFAQNPGERLAFQGWSGDATGASLTSDPILMDGPKTAIAQYGTQFYLDVSSAYGSVSGAGWYDQGTSAHAGVASQQVAVSPGTQELFVVWSGDATGTGVTSNGIVMDRPKVATAQWRTEYSLTIQTPYGTATTAGWYQAGSFATASLNASVIGTGAGERVVFKGWTGDAAGYAALGSSPILMSGPRTAHAEWSKEYFLQVITDVGTIGGSGWYREGTSVELTAPAEATSGGQTVRFSGWSGDVTSSDLVVTVTMTGPKEVKATWTTTGALGGLSGTLIGLILLIVGIALVVGLFVARRRGRRE